MAQILEPDKIYHLTLQFKGNDKLFYSEENYLFFLKLYAELLLPIIDTYAYCLLPNHFHCLIKIKNEKIIFDYLKLNNRIPEENLSLEAYKNLSITTVSLVGNIFSLPIGKQFSTFFKAYSDVLNLQQKRKSNLFTTTVNRIEISSDEEVKESVVKIHTYPVNSGSSENLVQWKYSSYAAYLSEKPSSVKRESVLDLFDGKENFTAAHLEKLEKISSNNLGELIKQVI